MGLHNYLTVKLFDLMCLHLSAGLDTIGTSSEAKASPLIGVRDMTHCGMTLTDYLNECKAQGVGLLTLADVMADTSTRLVKLADEVVNGVVALTVARGRLRVIMNDALSLCASIGKNDGWCYVMLDVKARDVLSFAGRLEVASVKVDLCRKAIL